MQRRAEWSLKVCRNVDVSEATFVLSVTVAPKMGSADVLEALYTLLLKRGKQDYIQSDNWGFTYERLHCRKLNA